MNDQAGLTQLRQAASAPLSPATPDVRRRWTAGRRHSLAVVLLLLLAAAGGAAWWGAHDSSAMEYVTVPVSRGAVARTVTATGTVNPELTIIVGSYISGVIQELSCDYNTRVKAGQVCARIDPRPYQSIVTQRKASLAMAEAQLRKDQALLGYTKLNHDRLQWLLARDSTSRDAADLARSAYEQAQAQVGLAEATIEQRKADLEAAEINLGYTSIVSPVDGTVVSRNVTQGQTVAASFQTPTLFLIATDLTRMQVDTNVSESDIGGIKTGNKAAFTVDAYPRRIFEGTVVQVRQSPQTVQNVVTYDAVVGVANPDLTLKPGMTASMRIVVAQKDDVLRVPNQALRYTPGGIVEGGKDMRVWVLRDGRPVAVVVVPGLDDEGFTEIVQGDLKAEDRVIVAGERPAAGRQRGVPPPRL